MRLLWHIVKKDFRHLWLGVVMVWVLATARIWIGFAMTRGDGSDAWHRVELEWARTTLTYLMWLLEATIAVWLVLEDGAARAGWWWTRPVRSGQMVTAKLTALVGFFWIPITLVSVPWWRASAFDAGMYFGAIENLLAVQLLLTLVPAAVIACFPGWKSLLGLGAVAVGLMIFGGIRIADVAMEDVEQPNGLWVLDTLPVLTILRVAIGASVVLALLVKYLTRRSVLAIAVGILVMEMTLGGIEWEILSWHVLPRDPQAKRAVFKEVPLEITKVIGYPGNNPKILRGLLFRGSVELDLKLKISSEYKVVPGVLRYTCHWPDGADLGVLHASSSAAFAGELSTSDVEPSIRVALGLDQARPAAVTWDVTHFYSIFVFNKWLHEAPAWSGVLYWSTAKPVLEWELPLRTEAVMEELGRHFRVAKVGFDEKDAAAKFTLAMQIGGSREKYLYSFPATGPTCYAIINRATRDLTLITDPAQFDEVASIDGVDVKWFPYTVPMPEGLRGQKPAAWQAWLDGASLVKLHFEQVERFQSSWPERKLPIDEVKKRE